MKKLLMIFITLLIGLSASAQTQPDEIIVKAGSEEQHYPISMSQHTKITFTDGRKYDEEPGIVVNWDGREAIVVDLGGTVGKVAVATKNVGATVVKTYGNEDLGTGFTDIEDANDPAKNTLKDGWYMPSYEELRLLVEHLEYDRNDVGLKWQFNDKNTELWIPGYVKNGNYFGEYAGAKVNDTDYAIMSFDMTSEDGQGWEKIVENNCKKDYNPLGQLYIRPFHHLKGREQKQLNIISDNGVIATYDVNEDLKVSFTPNASTAAMKIVFKDNAPIETEHELNNLQMEFNGCEMVFQVNDRETWYQVDDITEITFFEGTPSIHLTANEDPGNYGNYYTTFYSGLEAYSLPKGVKAYTAKIEEYDNRTFVRLIPIESAIIPQDEAVLLYTRNGSDITMNVADGNGVDKADFNMFDGVDVATDQAGSSNYMLSYGQNGLGFYKMSDSMLLSANKAFLPMSTPNMTKGLRMVFDNTDGGVTGIDPLLSPLKGDDAIYNIGGIRLNKLQKGINIVGGKKIVVK